ncbi:MAG: alpha/beta hydrolase [Spirochaetales bacterium]|nr:alpha/beta hydrolase [Spirochaetales bacterium]
MFRTDTDDKWMHTKLELEHTRLHYIRTGKGDAPPLLLVHGFSDDGSCWAPVAEQLEQQFDIVMPDMPGHGLSLRRDTHILPDMAGDLAALITELGFRQPFICGHSMGAMVSFELALRFPGMAGALVLEDPPWWSSFPGNNSGISFQRGEEPPVVRWARSLADKTFDQLVEEYRKDNQHWPDILIRNMARAKKRLDQSIITLLGRQVGKNGLRWKKEITKINIPVLLLTADPARGAMISPELSAKIALMNNYVTVRHFPETGHLIHFDRQEQFISEVRTFLATPV